MFMDISSSSSIRILCALIVHVNTKEKNIVQRIVQTNWVLIYSCKKFHVGREVVAMQTMKKNSSQLVGGNIAYF
jgi:hypothetical protein